MRNRCKTLLTDHSVPEVTLKACPKHYSVSAIPETLTVQGPKRPPMVHGHTRAPRLTSTIGLHAMFFQHVGKHCISLHARLEASWVGAQKAQMPMGTDMVVDGYVVSPHIVAEWAITATDIVHLPMIDVPKRS